MPRPGGRCISATCLRFGARRTRWWLTCTRLRTSLRRRCSRCFKGIGRLEADGSCVSSWLRTVVRCKAADHHRKAFRKRDKLPSAVDAAEDCLVDASPVGAAGDRGNAANGCCACLEEMPERQRRVLEWKYLDSLRVREMADRLGETEKAVETVLYRARIEFRRLFEQERFRGAKVTRLPGTGSDISPEST